jgi:thiamine-phosphate pyrophosphorylase
MFNYSLQLITDRQLCGERSVENVVGLAAQGGVNLVQLREKQASMREIIELGTQLKKLLHKYSIPLIINDRVDIAQAINAAGVHLGQEDLPFPLARKILGFKKIIGVSINNVVQAQEAEQWDVDYLGVGPIFATATKPDASAPLGIAELKNIREISRHPLIAIGGINQQNIKNVLQAGADGVAVVSSICAAEDPKASAMQLLQTLKQTCSPGISIVPSLEGTREARGG